MRYFTVFFLFVTISIFAQDSTRSQAFKDNFPRKYPLIKAKYPSYSLIAGYLLVTEANRNDPYAQHELGLRYLIANGFPPDTAKAIYWIRKAVDQNLPAARFNYGIMLYNGIGVPWNPFEAYQNFSAAANSGLADAQFAVGLTYTDNLLHNRNLNKAYHYFKLAAAGKYEPAKEAIKQLLKSGFAPQSDSLSRKEIQNIVKPAEETAQLMEPNWDLEYFDFDLDDKKDKKEDLINEVLRKKPEELKIYLGLDNLSKEMTPKDSSAIGLLTFASGSGSPEALLIAGRGHETGNIFKKDLVVAAFTYLRAYRLGSLKAGEYLFGMLRSKELFTKLKERISAGDPDAMYAWAGISALGFDNQISNQQALDFLKSAVEKKHIPSMIEMGLLYSTGTMVTKNKQKASEFWIMAKNLGSKEASVRLALGNIMDPASMDNPDDIATLIQISNEGSVLAQTALAYCYEKGLRLKESKGTAIRLYRQAAQRGNETAFNSLKRMYDELRPEGEEFKIYEINN
ncbi:MAG: hypothetical protein CVV24_10530 [Ignavibacteriae bacterium HGW-Ignavibacteriae-3]|nr:MAG: hypothetical protein CVV24_10530 [Ignavibacteriae bacterium HGW-Ignavibacteriae-3]